MGVALSLFFVRRRQRVVRRDGAISDAIKIPTCKISDADLSTGEKLT